jgi:hypothetical protein
MQFADRILLHLADPAARAALLPAAAAERLAAALFGIAPAAGQVFTIRIDRVAIAVALGGEWRGRASGRIADARQVDLDFTAAAPAGGMADAVVWGRLDAVLPPVEGRVVAIEARRIAWPTLAEIEAALPAAVVAGGDAAAIEAARRVALGRRIVAAPDDFTEPELATLIGDWLSAQGFAGVAPLIEASATLRPAEGLALRFEPAPPAGGAMQTMPFMACVVADDLAAAGPGLRGAIGRGRTAQRALAEAGHGTADTAGMTPRERLPVLLFVPQDSFADEAWPGAAAGAADDVKRTQRASAAARWLAEAGFVLVPA